MRSGKVLLGLVLLAPSFAAETSPTNTASLHAAVPAEIQVNFLLKNAGNNNLVGSPDMPVTVSVVLTNKTDGPLQVFAVRFLSTDDSDPLPVPLGCMIRMTDAKGNLLFTQGTQADGFWTPALKDVPDDTTLGEDPRNHFSVPPRERRAFSVPLTSLLTGSGAGPNWPVVGGKFVPGAYRFKFRWAGQESPEFSLTILPE